jgi:microcystin-dependent protein
MDNVFIGEIIMFGGNYAIQGFQLAQGQIVAIASNTALFSLLGTMYGGNGTTTFGLPDLRGRVAIGQGQGPGLTNRALGEQGGFPGVAINMQTMPSHKSQVGGIISLQVDINAATDTGTSPPPTDMVLAKSPGTPAPPFHYNTSSPDITLNAASASVHLSAVVQGSAVGNGQSHENRQPYLAINYQIAMQGVFPSRP